jgi:hypothetical protein
MNQLALFTDEQSPRSGAELSPCGRYRFVLWRSWSNVGIPANAVNFVMLNPSTADAEEDDPTIRRCVGYAKAWGYGGLIVTNLYPLRATDPRQLKTEDQPEGPRIGGAILGKPFLENDMHIKGYARRAKLVVCGWGNHGRGEHAERMLAMIRDVGQVPHCLALTGSGQLSHPLYLRSDLKPQPMP